MVTPGVGARTGPQSISRRVEGRAGGHRNSETLCQAPGSRARERPCSTSAGMPRVGAIGRRRRLALNRPPWRVWGSWPPTLSDGPAALRSRSGGRPTGSRPSSAGWLPRRLGDPPHPGLDDVLRRPALDGPRGLHGPAGAGRSLAPRPGGDPDPPPGAPERTVGHDTTLIGWPWVADTHSWLEPTAMTILALCRDGRADHPRVRAGLRLIRDRAIAAGGWNYGNNIAFGRDLRPQPAPTGLALLALARVDQRTGIVERALRLPRAGAPGDPRGPVPVLGRAGPAGLGAAPRGRRRLAGHGLRAGPPSP